MALPVWVFAASVYGCGPPAPDCEAVAAHSAAPLQAALPHASDDAVPAANEALARAVAAQVSALIEQGKLRGAGIWQRGEVRRKHHHAQVPLVDDAQAGLVDGFVYRAYIAPPMPRIARANPACDDREIWPDCTFGPIAQHVTVTLERTGGIAGQTSRTDSLLAYTQANETILCACPFSKLTRSLLVCCQELCCP